MTTTTHKTLRGPRGGLILCKKEHAKALDRAVFPGIQGGPLEHIIAAKAVAFGEALRPEFRDYQQAILDNAQTLAAELQRSGDATGIGWHGQPPHDGGCVDESGHHGQGSAGSAGRGRHRLQQEPDPL